MKIIEKLKNCKSYTEAAKIYAITSFVYGNYCR